MLENRRALGGGGGGGVGEELQQKSIFGGIGVEWRTFVKMGKRGRERKRKNNKNTMPDRKIY